MEIKLSEISWPRLRELFRDGTLQLYENAIGRWLLLATHENKMLSNILERESFDQLCETILSEIDNNCGFVIGGGGLGVKWYYIYDTNTRQYLNWGMDLNKLCLSGKFDTKAEAAAHLFNYLMFECND